MIEHSDYEKGKMTENGVINYSTDEHDLITTHDSGKTRDSQSSAREKGGQGEQKQQRSVRRQSINHHSPFTKRSN